MRTTTIADIRRFTVSRFGDTATLGDAIGRLGFVQADPIRAPARAQDLTLRQRVAGYRAGDLERRYPELPIEEDVFVNYGFVTRALQSFMHPRTRSGAPARPANRRERALLEFVRELGPSHPRDVDAHFSHGTVTNYWGGSSSATTHLLERLHYKGLLRVVRRDNGIRVYAVREHDSAPAGAVARRARLDALIDLLISKYTPVPAVSLSFIVRRLRYAAPQWTREITGALQRATRRLSRVSLHGHIWYWPADEALPLEPAPDVVRLLAPFDPVVWDRRRFELLWDWTYRFEAYTPPPRRTLGYYALPMLWRDRVIGWANVAMRNGSLDVDAGYVGGRPPRERAFKTALEEEVERMRAFLAPSAPG